MFLQRYPYYAAILAQLEPVADPSVNRMAVSLHNGRFFLHVNVESFVRDPECLRGVLLHEVHHIVLGHLSHAKFADCDYPELMTLAFEMSANEFIVEPLPNPILCKQFSMVGIRAGQSTLERYYLLADAHHESTLSVAGRRPGTDSDAEVLDNHSFLSSSTRESGGVEPTRRLLTRAMSEVGPDISQEPGSLLAGKEPGRLLEELLGVASAPERFIDYKTALRMFVVLAQSPVHSYARPNRRFPGRVGRIPGRTYSPRRLVPPSVLVAIDTSASMLKSDLEEVARQLAVLGEIARITVAECDVEVTRVYAFDGTLPNVFGRGGTDLRPVFEPNFLHAHAIDGVDLLHRRTRPLPSHASQGASPLGIDHTRRLRLPMGAARLPVTWALL